MRDAFSSAIVEFSKFNKNIFVVAADISPEGRMAIFQEKNKEKFINVGVAEQTMIGVCAGLAMTGKKPFAYTISTFALYRPFEMIRNDLCYQNLPVTIVGMGAGTIYSTLGATHLTQEDIAITRSIPNMQVLAPCDPYELNQCIKFCVEKSIRPTYLRIGKKGEKNFSKNNNWKFGKINCLQKGEKICIISYGPIIKKAFEIQQMIKKKISIYSAHSLKPFDLNGLNRIFKTYEHIITLEDHTLIGGLATIVNENSPKFKYKGKIKNFGLKDEFIHSYGTQDQLLDLHGVSNKKILNHLSKNNYV